MATSSGDRPTPDEARETLRRLHQDAEAVRYPPIPAWFFAAQAAAVAGLHLVRLLPGSGGGRYAQLISVLAIALAAGGLGQRYWLNRDGVAWASARPRDMLPFLALLLGSFAACWAITETTGARWVWILGAAFSAAVVLVTGARYRQQYGDGR
ncbi:hypothetical protein [Blastococcus sp. TF02A-30]|uniref:hypothetical protein n=1 Tax=Blastococcus sp. TF02A-30 TaxID=2250580 RepID=UPI000DEBCBC7|nr:hypothetical protein [Blastococcus sp. TF02A-30]RBY89238.1 hypothetical protein DQ241_07035 [Blastococcus sp. TF02A-30]